MRLLRHSKLQLQKLLTLRAANFIIIIKNIIFTPTEEMLHLTKQYMNEATQKRIYFVTHRTLALPTKNPIRHFLATFKERFLGKMPCTVVRPSNEALAKGAPPVLVVADWSFESRMRQLVCPRSEKHGPQERKHFLRVPRVHEQKQVWRLTPPPICPWLPVLQIKLCRLIGFLGKTVIPGYRKIKILWKIPHTSVAY